MLKHVQSSNYRILCSTPISVSKRKCEIADSTSLGSSASYFGYSSDTSLSSRSSSYLSLNDMFHSSPYDMIGFGKCEQDVARWNVDDFLLSNVLQEHTTLKVHVYCLGQDVEYKTLNVNYRMTSRQIIRTLLTKCKVKHRDPNLFYLSMELHNRKKGVFSKTFMILDDIAFPAELQSCYPKGDSRFILKMRKGSIVRIYYDNVLMLGSRYKCLLISDQTSAQEIIELVLNCSNCTDHCSQFVLYELYLSPEFGRKLEPDECPLLASSEWSASKHLTFCIRRKADSIHGKWNLNVNCGDEDTRSLQSLQFITGNYSTYVYV